VTPADDAILRLLPHRPPMLMVDGLEDAAPGTFRARLTLRPDNPFIDGDGNLERAAYPELIAQCFAAGAGSSVGGEDGGERPLGFLAGFRDIVVLADAGVGDVLVTEVTVATTLGNVSVVDGIVTGPQGVLATGQIKVYLEDGAARTA
jgi:predicted hotdog family 3-hydroxylacyl-ACP dehydratase